VIGVSNVDYAQSGGTTRVVPPLTTLRKVVARAAASQLKPNPQLRDQHICAGGFVVPEYIQVIVYLRIVAIFGLAAHQVCAAEQQAGDFETNFQTGIEAVIKRVVASIQERIGIVLTFSALFIGKDGAAAEKVDPAQTFHKRTYARCTGRLYAQQQTQRGKGSGSLEVKVAAEAADNRRKINALIVDSCSTDIKTDMKWQIGRRAIVTIEPGAKSDGGRKGCGEVALRDRHLKIESAVEFLGKCRHSGEQNEVKEA
jgi:hypothetical protein